MRLISHHTTALFIVRVRKLRNLHHHQIFTLLLVLLYHLTVSARELVYLMRFRVKVYIASDIWVIRDRIF